jgi:hypothetical protein
MFQEYYNIINVVEMEVLSEPHTVQHRERDQHHSFLPGLRYVFLSGALVCSPEQQQLQLKRRRKELRNIDIGAMEIVFFEGS